MPEPLGTATYSPEDDKLRFYAFERLDSETYQRCKAAGIHWAPKQKFFFAVWNPEREDIITELAGEIGDEDSSLVDRAEERAERFEGYQENRAKDAEQARAAVDQIADGIPLGQPILVGHHSERHARRDAKKIENGMRRAVKMWETSKYWKSRAAGAIRHAKYVQRPDVRARRIKKLGAALRKAEKEKGKAADFLKLWTSKEVTQKRALAIANYDWAGDWHGLDSGKVTPEEAASKAVACHERTIASRERWIVHIENRLTYERAMLEAQGASKLLEPAPKKKHPPLLNYRAESITCPNPYRGDGETITYGQVEMTRAEYKKIYSDYKGTRLVDTTEPTHRIRTAMIGKSGAVSRFPSHGQHVCVFLTDSKEHERPEQLDNSEAEKAEEKKKAALLAALDKNEEERTRTGTTEKRRWFGGSPPPEPKPNPFDAMKESLRVGVQTVSAPQLFPTPADLARRMAELAGIDAGQRILEPSAGTGRLLDAIWQRTTGPDCCQVVAVELNAQLAEGLRTDRNLRLNANDQNFDIRQADFMSLNGELGKFDRIIMNPPFEKGKDIAHIRHALTLLKPGGRLVALCADGPRQNEKLRPEMESWESLGSPFDSTGTRVALMTYEYHHWDAPEEEETPEPEPTSEVTELGEQYTVCEVNHPSMNEADQLTMF